MAMRVKDGVEPINRPTDMGRGGSRPKPPKAGARSASLEAPRPMSDHQTAKRRLTPKTVALDSAKGAALGTLHFSTGIQKPAPAKAGGFAFGGGPGGNASGRVSEPATAKAGGRALSTSASPDCPGGYGMEAASCPAYNIASDPRI
jgi:hypothetical protein